MPIFEKKTVLVTGGAGFIGSHLCEALLKEANVICLDDFSNSHPDNIKHLLQYPDFEFIKHDVNEPFDPEQFDELGKFKIKFQGIQEIYHLACPTSPKDFEDLKMKSLLANSVTMINTLDLAVRYHAKYVFASSSVVYGEFDDNEALTEDYMGVVDHLTPRSCYDEGKRFAETCVETYREIYGLDAKSARIFTTYGPRMMLYEGLLIPDFILDAIQGKDLTIYGDETYNTSLCFVTDMVNGLIRLMAADPELSLINLGGNQMFSMVEVAKKIISMTESSSGIKFEPALLFATRKAKADLTLAKEELDWVPLVRLEDGLQKTINFTIANKEALLFDRKR
ncbi:MAG: hypothetical protein A2538_03745 [Candidatus Magasanikbacteria bacterium RIFOXYD2_FULL_41_14]|uniref:NAD-dependent epimerase/dehydratase domain-containing protein n=1 Tax=Candidatus Magasanikbacteria bacterium RIFOXYD2_FULL_41_14 TaxID=1798709 RepID=A0A1F6PCU1_9BACT|nr:MAG: hypothetical protein A2538_03745 [Candidatus Magasanikbacteria bacterium RIFOXYD2_FULL_41_14]